MDPTTSESPPGCLVVLIPLSAEMAEDIRVRLANRVTPEGEPDIRELPKSFVARFLTDELLDGVVTLTSRAIRSRSKSRSWDMAAARMAV